LEFEVNNLKKDKLKNQAGAETEAAETVKATEAAETAKATETAEAADTENAEAADSENSEAEMSPEEALSKLAAAYATLEQEKQSLEGQLLRLQADFDNFRKRTRTEKEDWNRNITANFCSELLPVIDNFGRALQALRATGADESHLTGVEMIARQLGELLINKGVEKIATVGEPFDPNWHEAIGQTQVEDDEMVGKVTAEVQAGYRLGNKLLRVAMVHVGTK
jgi:molecular chaperone GrpE